MNADQASDICDVMPVTIARWCRLGKRGPFSMAVKRRVLAIRHTEKGTRRYYRTEWSIPGAQVRRQKLRLDRKNAAP